ncbi:hypothetical protein [Microbacterium murale]|uniref:Uncharacterized protein n=1 Tax=Microbacterium murale TaxID=1081040 RepID=A0ABU0PAP5_9MICO|nr:hypothetical protein [Microbacterium murale]MDQ0644007.1 hypothetical protein [Microbacterium murale]
MADKQGSDVVFSSEPVGWRSEELGLTVGATGAYSEYAARDGVVPDPAPLMTAWLTGGGQKIRRNAFADGDTVDGLTFQETYSRALANMAESPIVTEPAKHFAGLRISAPRAAGFLAVPDVLRQFESEVDGDLLVAAPTANTLLLAGSKQDDLVHFFGVALAECLAADPRGLSPVPLKVVTSSDGSASLERWDPGADSPWHPLYLRARQLELERRYGPMLQYDDIGSYTFRGAGAACASPRWAYDETTKLLRSYAVWTPGYYPTLLPPVDWIAVNQKTSRSAPQLWLSRDELAACAGVEVTPTDEFGLAVDVVRWTEYEADRDGVALKAALRDAGARTTAKIGGTGASVHIFDWMPGRFGGATSRFTTFDEFPQMQRPPSAS